jgi:hypothetical protein
LENYGKEQVSKVHPQTKKQSIDTIPEENQMMGLVNKMLKASYYKHVQ